MVKNILGKLTQNQNLSEREVADFVVGIKEGAVSDVQLSGFLVALVMKGPTIKEVAYIARAMRENCVQIKPKVSGNLTDMCGTGGGLTTFNVSTANAILTAAAGVPVAKHGSRSISASSGSADALEALGIYIDLTPEEGRRLIEQIGISFLYAPNFHPIMLKVFGPEQQLGIKTIFFTIIGPLINPAGAPHHLMGVYRPELVSMVADVVAELHMKHVMVVHGLDGLDEVSILGRTSVAEVKGTKVEKYEISPEDFGLSRCSLEEVAGGPPEFNAKVIRDLFDGKDRGPRRAFLVLNNGVTLYVAGKAGSIEKGIQMAQENIDSGAGTRKLDEFVKASSAIKGSA